MTTTEIINHDLPILKLTDTVSRALLWMEENRIGQLVVVDEGKYIGIVTEDTLLNYEEEMRLEDVMMQYSEIYLLDYQHIYEALGFISKYQMQVVGVVDSDNNFKGLLTANDIYSKFSTLLGSQENGSILVISLKNRDYSLAEISRLIESDNAKILSSYFSGNKNLINDNSQLTFKIDRENISSIVATLERFGYNVEAAYAHQPIESLEQERYDMLMKYLEM